MKKIRVVFALALAATFAASCGEPIVPPAPTQAATATSAPQPTFTPIPAEVNIKYPLEGGKVSVMEIVKGSSQALPQNSVIWALVFIPSAGRYYPQNAPADMQVKGDWSSIVYVGQEGEAGLKADIVIVLADESAQQAIQAYLQSARDTQNSPGLERIPEGALIYDRITVERK